MLTPDKLNLIASNNARNLWPQAFQGFSDFEDSPVSYLDKEFKPFWHKMPIAILDLLHEAIECRKEMERLESSSDSQEAKERIASDALKRCLSILPEVQSLDYQLFILTLRQYFLLFCPPSQSKFGRSALGKTLIPTSPIPKSLLTYTLRGLIQIQKDRLYNLETQIAHFSFLIPSYKAYGFDAMFDAFYVLLRNDMSVQEFEEQLKYNLYFLNMILENYHEYNIYKFSEGVFLREIKESGIRKSISLKYFLHGLSHNEIDLNMLNVWMHVFSQLPMDEVAYIANEARLFLYTRFELIEPTMESKWWFEENQTLAQAKKVLERHGYLNSNNSAPGYAFRLKRGVLLTANIPLSQETIDDLKLIPGVREVKLCKKIKSSFRIMESLNLLKTAGFLLKGPVIDMEALKGLAYYFHSFIPFGELTQRESKKATKLYRKLFKELECPEKDRLYLELVYRCSGSLKKWGKEEVNWEKEACKLVQDYIVRKYPIQIVKSRIQALFYFFQHKKDFRDRANFIKRDLCFEVSKRSSLPIDKVKWYIEGLASEPIDNEPIDPFLAAYPMTILGANNKISLSLHLRLITLMRKCYKLSPFIIDSWIRKFLQTYKSFPTLTYAELLAIMELLLVNGYSIEAWKDIFAKLISIPIHDKLTHSSQDVKNIISTILAPLDLLLDSFLTSLEMHKQSQKTDEFNAKDLIRDVREQYFINSAINFIQEFIDVDMEVEKSIIRYNKTLQTHHAEEILRKAIMAFPEKLKSIQTKIVALKLIDYCFGQLDRSREKVEFALRTSLKMIEPDSQILIKGEYVKLLSEGGKCPHIGALFADLWLRQMGENTQQCEMISFDGWKIAAEFFTMRSYNFHEWSDLIGILDIPIEDDFSKVDSSVKALAIMNEPIDIFVSRFTLDMKKEKKEKDIPALVADIKDKYYLNAIMNFVREYRAVMLRRDSASLDRKIILFKLINDAYEKLTNEKERAEAFINKMSLMAKK